MSPPSLDSELEKEREREGTERQRSEYTLQYHLSKTDTIGRDKSIYSQ